MPFVVQRDGFILSPYSDYLGHFFRRDWNFAPQDSLGIMIKIVDSPEGAVSKKRIEKDLSDSDTGKLADGAKTCYEIFKRLGVRDSNVVIGTLNAGHPGGMLPLKGREIETFHPASFPDNVMA